MVSLWFPYGFPMFSYMLHTPSSALEAVTPCLPGFLLRLRCLAASFNAPLAGPAHGLGTVGSGGGKFEACGNKNDNVGITMTMIMIHSSIMLISIHSF